jgi:hypothetical protein
MAWSESAIHQHFCDFSRWSRRPFSKLPPSATRPRLRDGRYAAEQASAVNRRRAGKISLLPAPSRWRSRRPAGEAAEKEPEPSLRVRICLPAARDTMPRSQRPTPGQDNARARQRPGKTTPGKTMVRQARWSDKPTGPANRSLKERRTIAERRPENGDPVRTTRHNTARRRREVAQILQRLPADDRLQEPAPCTSKHQHAPAKPAGWRFEGFKPQSRRRPVSSTSAPPSADGSRSCTLQVCISRHRLVDVKSSTGFGAHRSEARLLLLLGGDLALGRRLLLRGGLRLHCFLHHVALLVRAEWWMSHQYLRES